MVESDLTGYRYTVNYNEKFRVITISMAPGGLQSESFKIFQYFQFWLTGRMLLQSFKRQIMLPNKI